MSSSILLDRTYTQALFLHMSGVNVPQFDMERVVDLLKNYDRILYETSGVSAIEVAIRDYHELRDKMTALPSRDLGLLDGEAELLRTTKDVAQRDLAVIASLQQFQIAKGGTAREPDEILGYAMRLILLARRWEADLLTWGPRVRILRRLFEAAGFAVRSSTIHEKFADFMVTGAQFPYLPCTDKAAGDHVFRIVYWRETEVIADRPREISPGPNSPSPVSPDKAAETGMTNAGTNNLLGILDRAIKNAPRVGFAYGIVGVAAAVALLYFLLGSGRAAWLSLGAGFVATILFFLFSAARGSESPIVRYTGEILAVIVAMAFSAYILGAVLAPFQCSPKAFVYWFGLQEVCNEAPQATNPDAKQ